MVVHFKATICWDSTQGSSGVGWFAILRRSLGVQDSFDSSTNGRAACIKIEKPSKDPLEEGT